MEPNVTVKNVFKDSEGRFLLPLGNLEGKMRKRVFSLRNNGSAPSFAHVSFVSYEPCLFSNVHVTPPAVVLLADEEKEVTITFTLKKRLNQLKKCFIAPVINSGKLKLLCGNEMDSGRLRQLYKNASEKALPTNPDVEKLLEVLPVESMPIDLKLMREPMSALDDIMRLITTQEIVVTLDLKLTKQLVL